MGISAGNPVGFGYFSVTVFRFASPASKSPPIILSTSMNRCSALAMRFFWPLMLHVTTVAALLLELHRRHRLQRPAHMPWMARHAALRIRERHDEDQPLRSLDLAVDEPAPPVAAVGRRHAVVEDAAGAQVDLAGVHLEACWPPPLLQALGFGPRLPHPVARRIKDARDNELVALFDYVLLL